MHLLVVVAVVNILTIEVLWLSLLYITRAIKYKKYLILFFILLYYYILTIHIVHFKCAEDSLVLLCFGAKMLQELSFRQGPIYLYMVTQNT
ncbi:hypothetical protein ACJX0J_031513, partial [Zea mays]